MEIAIAIGGLAAVFAGLGALILFTPMTNDATHRRCGSPIHMIGSP
jgi:hypothetical protein